MTGDDTKLVEKSEQSNEEELGENSTSKDQTNEAPEGEDKEKFNQGENSGKESKETGERPRREKRVRKSADNFVPDDFAHKNREVTFVDGRGSKLRDIPAVKESVESFKDSAEELFLCHRVMFSTRGKPDKKQVKDDILAFSGYLEKKQPDIDEKKQEKLDEDTEAKMSARVYRLKVPEIKKLCDLLAIDRSGLSSKDDIVDKLMDFLGSPDESYCKGSKKAGRPSKKAKVSATGYSDLDNEYEEMEDIVQGELPTDHQLRQWVKAYVRCFNMEKSTIRHALEVAGDKFGVDLSEKKSLLKDLLTEEM